jgi:hypothetical protein
MSDNQPTPIAKAEHAGPIDLSEAVFFISPSEKRKWAKGESVKQVKIDNLKMKLKAAEAKDERVTAEVAKVAKLVGLPIESNQNEVPKVVETTDTLGAITPKAMPTPTDADSQKNGTPHANGPDGGRWLWWDNKQHDIPQGALYRLLSYMWNRESANYDQLYARPNPVYADPVADQTIRSASSKLNKILDKIGVSWRLRCDSRTRFITKQNGHTSKKKHRRKGHSQNP